MNKYIKEWQKEGKIKFVGGYFDGILLDAKAISRIASLPSREVLLAKLLGSMMSPVSGLARFFDGAKKSMEARGLKTAKDLIGSSVAAIVAEVVAVAPKAAEVAPEATVEAPAPEALVESVPEAVAEVAPETKEEVVA